MTSAVTVRAAATRPRVTPSRRQRSGMARRRRVSERSRSAALGTVASAAGAVRSAIRSGNGQFWGHPENVTHTALGVDERGAVGIDLAPEVGDVGLDDAGLAAEVVVPDVVEDLQLGEHPVGVEQQVAQQLELGGGQVDDAATAAHLVAVLVELEVVEAERGAVVGLPASAAQDRPDAGDDLFEAERLGDVVVPAHGEALDLVASRVASGDEDDRLLSAAVAQATGHLEAVNVGEPDVEHDEVGLGLGGHGEGGRAVTGRLDLEAGEAE